MGRLYDKIDLAFNTDFWNRQEAQLSADIANGLLQASILDTVLDERASCNCSSPCGRPHFKHVKVREAFKLRKQQERMKLLRTAMLLSDLHHAEDNFKSCPHCHYEAHGTKTWIIECDIHKPAFKKAKSAVYWAGVHNLEERQARGQIRDAEALATQDALEGQETSGQTGLNKWELMHQQAKYDGVWPAEARDYDTTPDYPGFLWVLYFEEEMSEGEYLEELRRFKATQRELEDMAPQWAGIDTTHQGTRKQKETFRRDTRFNTA